MGQELNAYNLDYEEYIYIHTHTHTHIFVHSIYIYIYMETQILMYFQTMK